MVDNVLEGKMVAFWVPCIRLKLSIVTLSRSSGVPMNPCTVRAYVDFDVEEAPQI